MVLCSAPISHSRIVWTVGRGVDLGAAKHTRKPLQMCAGPPQRSADAVGIDQPVLPMKYRRAPTDSALRLDAERQADSLPPTRADDPRRVPVQHQLRDDLQNQRLMRTSLDLDEVFTQAASELSRLYTAKHLARILDLLHVAAAHIATCKTFVSADDCQLAVAKASGLKVIDIRRGLRRRRR